VVAHNDASSKSSWSTATHEIAVGSVGTTGGGVGAEITSVGLQRHRRGDKSHGHHEIGLGGSHWRHNSSVVAHRPGANSLCDIATQDVLSTTAWAGGGVGEGTDVATKMLLSVFCNLIGLFVGVDDGLIVIALPELF